MKKYQELFVERDVSLGLMYQQAGGANSKEIQRNLAALCSNSWFVFMHITPEVGRGFLTPISIKMQM